MQKCFFYFFILIPYLLSAQNYEIDTYNGLTITTCNGFFYDSGGPSGSYSNNETKTITFHSGSPINTHIKVYFHEFDIDPSDTLFIYDGSNTSAPLIGMYNDNNTLYLFPVQASITNASGDLTFKFKSNSTVINLGWKGEVTCIPECQIIFSQLDSIQTVPHPNDSNYVDVCLGGTISFTGMGVYLQNNMVYNQSDATSTFLWDFGDGTTGVGQTISHTYTQVNGYDVNLTITDSHGCVNTNYPGIRVRVSDNPIVGVNILPDICAQTDSIIISAGYNPSSTVSLAPIDVNQGASQGFDSTLFIPDGPGCSVLCYSTAVTFTSFASTATVTSASDILSVCVNMEHSYVGDLSFTIICPNGQSDTLKSYNNFGSGYMGIPFGWDSHENYDSSGCNSSSNPLGIPLEYCWSEIYPNIGTINSNSSLHQLPATNTAVDTGYYYPDESFSNLIGCPLNGTWNIEICDNWLWDNGYIFDWTLNFDPSLLSGWSYSVPIDSIEWSGPFIVQQSDSSIIVYPDSGGTYNYNVTIYDDFGCSYDTVVTLNVNPIPDIAIIPPNPVICAGSNVALTASGATTYTWSPGTGLSSTTGSTVTANPATTTTYIVTGSTGGCTNTATVTVIVNNSLNVTVSPMNPTICPGANVQLSASGANNYVWSPSLGLSSTTDSIVTASPSTTTTYTVVGNSGGCTDSTTVTVNVNSSINAQIISNTDASCGLNNGSATASGGSGYIWSDGQLTSVASNLTPGIYTVTVSSGSCSDTATVTIYNVPGFTVSVDSTNESCGHSNGTATANPNGGSGVYTYSWSTIPMQTQQTATNLPAGNYTVTVNDGNCTASATISVINLSGQSVTISNVNNTTCGYSNGGATINVTGGTPGYMYAWNTIPAQTTQNLQNVIAGTYTITVYDSNNCSATNSVTIIDSPGPAVQITNIVPENCGFLNGSLTAVSTGGTPPYTYQWSTIPVQNTSISTGLPTGIYTVTVSDANGCTTMASEIVPVIGGPIATVTATPEYCDRMDGMAYVITTGGTGNYTYIWDTNPQQTADSATGLSAGNYTVTVNDGGCSITITVAVPAVPGPNAGFVAHPTVLTTIDGPVKFDDISNGSIISWEWNLGNGSTIEVPYFDYTYNNPGTYNVTLAVTDNNGCMDSVSDTILVKDIFTLYIPNTFSPNDDGLNDLFFPQGMNVDPDEFKMYIFDRWGNELFYTDKWDTQLHRSEAWNGTKFNKGTLDDVVLDVYVYRVLAKELNGPPHEYIGNINLLP